MRRAVFLDRDGVINRAIVRQGKPYPPANIAEVEILPGVDEALGALHDAGYMLIVVTNQPDVARGITSIAVVIYCACLRYPMLTDRIWVLHFVCWEKPRSVGILPDDPCFCCIHYGGCQSRRSSPGCPHA